MNLRFTNYDMPIIVPTTLTEEYRTAIRICYKYAVIDSRDSVNENARIAGYERLTLLEALFGKEFFKEKGD